MHYFCITILLIHILLVFGDSNFTASSVPSSATPTHTVHPSYTVGPTIIPYVEYCYQVKDANNKTCVKLCLNDFNVTTTFDASTKKAYNTTTLPIRASNLKVGGACSSHEGVHNVSRISFTWSDTNRDYSLTLNFSSNLEVIKNKNKNSGKNVWYLSSVGFTNSTNKYHLDTSNNATIHATIGRGYTCNKPLSLKMGTATNDTIKDTFATLHLNDYTVQAFASSETKYDFGTKTDCVTKENLPAYIPIIVGCALAGLVLLVLVAYVIGRCYKRKQDQYETLS